MVLFCQREFKLNLNCFLSRSVFLFGTQNSRNPQNFAHASLVLSAFAECAHPGGARAKQLAFRDFCVFCVRPERISARDKRVAAREDIPRCIKHCK